MNDRYKEELLEVFADEVAEDVDAREFSAAVIKDSELQIWVGAVIKLDLVIFEVEDEIIQRYGKNSGVKCLVYSQEYACAHGFTGMPKELWGGATDDYYFIYRAFDPKTKIDKRNSGK